MFGNGRSRRGTLINIDYPDAIFKMEDTEELKMLPLKFLAKLGKLKFNFDVYMYLNRFIKPLRY